MKTILLLAISLPLAAQFPNRSIVKLQTGTTYTAVASDWTKQIVRSNAGSMSDTLPQATAASGFGYGWWACWSNIGAGTVTITPTTSTIDGHATLVLGAGNTTTQGTCIRSNGVNYYSFGTAGGGGGGSWGSITGTLSSQTDLNTALGLKAPLLSPVFTGQPTVPDFTLAGHTHQNTAGGGTLSAAAIAAGILTGAVGGTGNGFFAISGPASTLKTHTWPNASINFTSLTGVGTWSAGTPGVVSGTATDCVKVNGTSGSCGGAGTTIWQTAGSTTATEGTANFVAGTGVALTGSNPAGKYQLSVATDTAVIQSLANDQSGAATYCRSTNGSTVGACTLTPTLTTYTAGGCFTLNSSTANTTTFSINMDTLGALSVLSPSGGALTAGDITANQSRRICLNSGATAFNLQGGSGTSVTGGSGISVSSAVVSQNPFDFSSIILRDTFCTAAQAAGSNLQYFGGLSWTGVNDVGTGTLAASNITGGGCQVTLTTGGTTNDITRAHLANTTLLAVNPSTVANVEVQYVVRLGTITSVMFNVGFVNGSLNCINGAANCLGVSFNTADGDTVFKFRSCASSTCTSADSTVTVAANTTYTIRIRVTTAGTWRFSVNGETEQTITTNLPNENEHVQWWLKTLTGSARTMLMRGFGYLQTGVTL